MYIMFFFVHCLQRFDCKQCQYLPLVKCHGMLELMIVQGKPSKKKVSVDCTKVGANLSD